jgi:hypothetical protein
VRDEQRGNQRRCDRRQQRCKKVFEPHPFSSGAKMEALEVLLTPRFSRDMLVWVSKPVLRLPID